jgi:hypothetical protein
LTLAAGLTAAIAPAANAATPDYEIVFQANTGSLWYDGNSGAAPANLGMAPGTSPAIAVTGETSYMAVFQANTNTLWSAGTGTPDNWGLAMAPGTSPAITNLMSGGFQVAYQASTGILWTTGTDGTYDANVFDYDYLTLTMFQGFNGDLWTSYGESTVDTGLAMKAGTSPSVTALEDGTPEVAYQGSNGDLWVATRNADNGDWTGVDQGLGMMAGTSPAIIAYYPCSICRNQ